MSPEEKFAAIVDTVCRHYNVPRNVLMGPRTSQAISRARHMSMALCYAMVPEWTTIEIGRRHNRKSGHCITLYAKNKVLADERQKEVHAHLVDVLVGKGLPR
jgi:chromosomal replication initiation ATPase DnaA